MYRKLFSTFILVTILAVSATAFAVDSELITAGRSIVEKYKDTVVTVRAVITLKFQGQEQERKADLIGTVVREDGLTVVALSSIDPAGFLGGSTGGIQIESVVSSLDILRTDGTEIEAVEVIRDPELDLAFIRPKEKLDEPLPFVDLSNSGEAQILDYVVVLNRLGQIASRANAATFEQIEAVVQKPRTFYIPSSSITNSNSGNIAFNLNGTVLGLFVLRSIHAGEAQEDVAGILLPAEDVLDGVSQAPGFDE